MKLHRFASLLVAGATAVAPALAQMHADSDPAAASGGAQVEASESARRAGAEAGEEEDERRDPFRPFLLSLRPDDDDRVQRVGVTAYELRQLQLVAVLWDMSPPRAVLQDSSGMGYIVTVGTQVGRRGGTVAAIQPGRLIVEERQKDFYGQEQVTKEILEIPREEEPQVVKRE